MSHRMLDKMSLEPGTAGFSLCSYDTGLQTGNGKIMKTPSMQTNRDYEVRLIKHILRLCHLSTFAGLEHMRGDIS